VCFCNAGLGASTITGSASALRVRHPRELAATELKPEQFTPLRETSECALGVHSLASTTGCRVVSGMGLGSDGEVSRG
jgi:hypothetical protein